VCGRVTVQLSTHTSFIKQIIAAAACCCLLASLRACFLASLHACLLLLAAAAAAAAAVKFHAVQQVGSSSQPAAATAGSSSIEHKDADACAAPASRPLFVVSLSSMVSVPPLPPFPQPACSSAHLIPPSRFSRTRYVMSIAITSIISTNITRTPRSSITPHAQLAALP